MSGLCYLLALIVFVVRVFDGHVGTLNLIALGLAFISLGLLLSGDIRNPFNR